MGSVSGGGRRTLLCVTVGEPAPVSTVTPTQPARLTDGLLIHLHHGKYTLIASNRNTKVMIITVTAQLYIQGLNVNNIGEQM